MEKLKVGQTLKFITFFGLSGMTGKVTKVLEVGSTLAYEVDLSEGSTGNPILHDLLVHAVTSGFVKLIND